LRLLTLIFVILIAALQYPLWLGKGSWLRVWDLNRQIAAQKEENDRLKARNDMLDAEVRDLKQGYAAIEERARSELGMIRHDEVFYQVIDEAPSTVPPATPSSQKQ
jgi:cell division protein FtsB